MAIFYDTSAISTDQTSSPLTWNHTIVAGPNILLVVGITLASITSQPSTSAVTYNGVSMTKARSDQQGAISELLETSVWFLFNPSTGTNQISATFSGGASPHAAGSSSSYVGAQKSNTADASNGTTGTTTGDKTVSVTTVSDNCWIFGVCINTSTTSPTAAADQTSRQNVTLDTTTAGIMRIEDTNQGQTPAGAKTVGFTIGAGVAELGYSMTFASFAPYSGISFRPSKEVGRIF